MKILVNCEESQAVCIAFRKRGHQAYSCDLQECSGGHPEWHIIGDALVVMMGGTFKTQSGESVTIDKWDMMIAHPPCTHLSVSGAKHFKKKIEDGRQGDAIDFFMKIANSYIEKTVVEQPISIMSTRYRKPDQIIQPWMFGHGETKSTCLWLKGLPKLIPTDIVSGRSDRIHKMPPGPNRAKERSRTYQGIAEAMADQWSP